MAINTFGCNCAADVEWLKSRVKDLTSDVTMLRAQIKQLQNPQPTWFPTWRDKEELK